MGSRNGKHANEKENNKRRSHFRRIFQINQTPRPLSFAGTNEYYQEDQLAARPMSMIDVGPFDDHFNLNPNAPVETMSSTAPSTSEEHDQCDENPPHKYDETHWQWYIPLTLEKLRTIIHLNKIIFQRVNNELTYILNRLLRLEQPDEHQGFLRWFLDEIEYYMHSTEDEAIDSHKSLLLRSIEQDRFDCAKYLLEQQLLLSKLDINTINEQGRHCLLMLAHKNGPIDLIKYLLSHHLSCLDTNKIDLNRCSSLHHASRHFNLTICELLLPYTSKQVLQIENAELHTPLDYWLECLFSLKKLKSSHLQHDIDSLRLDQLLTDANFPSNIYFLQMIINRGGQVTKLPLRYIRSILPQLSFEQKLSYVDHHVNLCCLIYKNRLSSLLHNYDQLKISLQASEILTEFIYALGTVQVEIQTRLAENACSTDKEHSMKLKEHQFLQSTMRMLYAKFFRLFECIYTNPDVNVKNFYFEHIFRRVWVYWKEPVKAFLKQSREKSLSLKAICRVELFKRLVHYPGDIQHLPINSFLKQFLAFDNQFFVVQRKF